ncbi:Ig-like domain-containing protein [Caproiciproducens faecalis]|uniref:Ig-like domain-containing protein n=1 Tax=Caproiciproducens faecalis TaxID=2820301 RepID=A0ABS7DMD9_9FIRM|nr:Ig-like domain-containing protein [Caproiciproducens faecalis]MBW7572469.1 Ig-like domain-containing protein [Caproiciproducens faecalis]
MNRIEKLWNFFQFEKGQQITINGVQNFGIISSASENPTYYDDQYLRTDVPITTGDIIVYQNKKWVVISQPEENSKTYRAKIRESDFVIKVYIGEILHEFDSMIDSVGAYVENGKVINTAAGEIIVTVPSNEYSDKIEINARFIKLGYAWKVSGVDRSKKGLNMIHADKDVFIDDDDKQNEIADYYKHNHQYAITVSNQQPIEVTVGGTTQLILIVTDKGSQVSTLPQIICTSSNEAIATVSNTGLITGISNGEASITAVVSGYPQAAVTVSTKVTGTVTPSYSVEITFKNTAEIRVGGYPKPFTAVVYENGTAITTKSVTWSVKNKDYTGDVMATLSDMTGTTCKLAALNNNAYIGHSVILTATLSDDSTVFYDLNVLIISYT